MQSPVLKEPKSNMETRRKLLKPLGKSKARGTKCSRAGSRFSNPRLQLNSPNRTSLLALDSRTGWGETRGMDGSQGLTEVLPGPDPGYDRCRQGSS